jgi:hypothetical protein
VRHEVIEILSPETSEPWLAGLLEQLAPVVERTSTDAGLLDWKLAEVSRSSWPRWLAMREAVVLARHLGLPYDDLLARAETLAEKDAELRAAKGEPRQYRDRQTTYPQEWSHQRFVRFLESIDA